MSDNEKLKLIIRASLDIISKVKPYDAADLSVNIIDKLIDNADEETLNEIKKMIEPCMPVENKNKDEGGNENEYPKFAI